MAIPSVMLTDNQTRQSVSQISSPLPPPRRANVTGGSMFGTHEPVGEFFRLDVNSPTYPNPEQKRRLPPIVRWLCSSAA